VRLGTGDSDAFSPDGDHGFLPELTPKSRQDLIHQTDPFVREHIRQTDQTAVRRALDEEEFPKILVHRHQDTILDGGAVEQNPVSGVGTPLLGFNDIVPLLAQPLRQAPPGATVDEESQRLATRTASRDSSATTA